MMNMGSLRGLHRRLERVESRAISDTSRHVPLSQEWWTYWDERLDCLFISYLTQSRSSGLSNLGILRVIHRLDQATYVALGPHLLYIR